MFKELELSILIRLIVLTVSYRINLLITLEASVKYLRIYVDRKSKFGEFIIYLLSKVSRRISIVIRLRNIVPKICLSKNYKVYIKSELQYGPLKNGSNSRNKLRTTLIFQKRIL